MKSRIISKNVVVRTYVWTALDSFSLFLLANFFLCMFKDLGQFVRIPHRKDSGPQPFLGTLGTGEFNLQVSA